MIKYVRIYEYLVYSIKFSTRGNFVPYITRGTLAYLETFLVAQLDVGDELLAFSG